MTTTYLNKIGNAYATTDLTYRLYKKANGWWHLYCADYDGSPSDHPISRQRRDAIIEAERFIALSKVGNGQPTATSSDDLPWNRTEILPSNVFSAKFHDSLADYPCVCCGRNCSTDALHVIVVDGGARMCKPEDANDFETHDGGWMGAWPVGRECAKQFADGYLTKITNK